MITGSILAAAIVVGAIIIAATIYLIVQSIKRSLRNSALGVASSLMNQLLRTGASAAPEVIVIKQSPRVPSQSELRKKAMNDLGGLARRDPDFSLPEFEAMAAAVFTRWHEALYKKDSVPVRNHLMPGLRGRIEEEIDKLKREGRHYVCSDINVTGIEIAEVGEEGAYDSITTIIRARANGEAGQKRALKGRLTFLRSGEVKTMKGESGPTVSKCPSCGAPLSISAAGKCDYCDTEVNLPAFAWTLSAIDNLEDQAIAEDASGLKVIGQIKCPRCGKMVNDLEGVTTERCPRCGAMINTGS